MNVTGRKISATLHTIDYRGDHAADCEIAIDVDPDETVAELVGRTLRGGIYITPWAQKLVLRIVAEKDDVLP